MGGNERLREEQLFFLRMRARLVAAHFYYDEHDPSEHNRTIEEIQSLSAELQDIETKLEEHLPKPDEFSCLVHDDPLFGAQNPPEPHRYLYHYTSAFTLAKIRKDPSLRFGPFAMMNDPHEALDVCPTSMGLISKGNSEVSKRASLSLTPDEARRFEGTDWSAEINACRRQVKVGSFAEDGHGGLREFPLDDFWPGSIARRLHAARGFAHPRMWSQYADDSKGICLVFDFERLIERFVAVCERRQIAGAYGPVQYASADFGASLGFIDIGTLLEKGGRGAVLENYETALLEKHEDWKHEAEFRLLVIDEPDEAFFLPLERGDVAGVLLGPRFNRAKHMRYVKAFARDFGISGRVRQIRWMHGPCEITFPS